MINTYVKSLNKHRRILAMARTFHIKEIQRILNQKLLKKYNNVKSMN